MTFARTILAICIAFSVVMVPATGGANVSTKPVEMSMTDHADMPCCPPSDDGKGTVACAFKCLNFVAAIFPPAFSLSIVSAGLPPSVAEATLHGRVIAPTHPPPI